MGHTDEKSLSGLSRESPPTLVDDGTGHKHGAGKLLLPKQLLNGKEGCFGIGSVKYCLHQKDI